MVVNTSSAAEASSITTVVNNAAEAVDQLVSRLQRLPIILVPGSTDDSETSWPGTTPPVLYDHNIHQLPSTPQAVPSFCSPLAHEMSKVIQS